MQPACHVRVLDRTPRRGFSLFHPASVRDAGTGVRDGLAGEEWEKEVEHSARVAKRMLTFLTTRYPDLFQSKKVPWYVATDEDNPK